MPPPVPTPQVSLWALEWARPPPRGCAPGARGWGGSGWQRDGVWKRAGVQESRPCARLPSGKRRLAPRCGPTAPAWPAPRVPGVRPAPPGGAPGGSACARPEVTFRCPQAEPAPPGAKQRGRGTGRPAPSGPPPQTRRRARRRGGQSTGLRSVSFDFPCFSSHSRHPNKGPEKGKKRTVFSFSSNYKKPKSLLHLSSQWTTCLACLVFKYLG